MPEETLDGIILICKEKVEINETNKSNSVDLVMQLVKNQNLTLGGKL